MILRTARFSCVIYAEICVNAALIICMPSVCLSTRLSPSLTPHPPLPQSSRVHSAQARVRAQNWRIEKGESSAQWKSAINRIKVPQRDLRMAKVITPFNFWLPTQRFNVTIIGKEVLTIEKLVLLAFKSRASSLARKKRNTLHLVNAQR